MKRTLTKPDFAALREYLGICTHVFMITVRQRPKAVAAYISGAVLEVASFIGGIYATAQLGALIARYRTGGDTHDIWVWLALDMLSLTLIGIAFWIMRTADRLIYYQLAQWASNAYQDILTSIDIGDYYDTDIRDRLNKIEGGYTWKISSLAMHIMNLFYALLRFVVTALVVAQINWWLMPLIAIFLIPSLLLEARFAKLQWGVWQEKGDNNHIFWGLSWLLRQPASQMEIRSMQSGKYITQRIRGIQHEFYQEQERNFTKLNRIMFPNKMLENAGSLIGSVMLLRQFLGGFISLDRYFFLSGALLRISGSIGNMFGILGQMQEELLFMKDFFSLMEIQPQIVDKPEAIKLSNAGAPSIEFQDVSFSYPGHDRPVFEHLNLQIPAGQHVALVGENGAGKSTFIKLLLRFYRPDSGRILIDGVDLQDIAIDSWYSKVALLSQEFNRYSFSVQENIEIARPSKAGNKKRLREAADFADITDMVNHLPHKWDTVLHSSFKKGVEPSGGQWQRVALARAFYRQATALILDEPTSAIDAKAEYDIFNNIFSHTKDKTAIIVSHRFSTVRRADMILVIESGKIIESGTHQSLMKLHTGTYHKLFSKQAEGYKD